jgi:hypothetical protein
MLTFADVSEVFSRSRTRSNVGNVSACSVALGVLPASLVREGPLAELRLPTTTAAV